VLQNENPVPPIEFMKHGRQDGYRALSLSFARSAARLSTQAALMPGGVGSDFRLGVMPTPLVIDRGSGPYLWDIDGNRLIDYYLGMGPMILGHSPAGVIRAVADQVNKGILFAGQSEIEYEAANLVSDMVPCAEMVRFGSSGTEVVQAALRLARAATGRSTVVAFEGHYHGWLDNIFWSRGSTPADLLPMSKGQDLECGRNLELHAWNRTDELVARINIGDLAAVIMEPSMCNTSAIRPRPGFLEAVREACTKTGTVLIFDEVITGFRLGPGGAQLRLGVTPDLATFGKAIASGFPVSCLAGRVDLMDQIGGPGNVIHAGTYNGQAVVMAATVATLKILSEGDVYEAIEREGTRLMTGLERLFASYQMPVVVQGWPQIFHVAFGVNEDVWEYHDYLKADRIGYVDFAAALLSHGVRVLERGAWFMSSAHDTEVVDETLEAVDLVLASGSE